MEGGKKKSGSSLASELFGEKDSLSASSSVFGSIFAPPHKSLGRDYETERKNGSGKQAWTPKTGVSDSNVVGEGETKSRNSYLLNEKVQPFNYDSSIYYGGQDVYNRPPQAAKNPVFTTFKDGGEDDSGGASRGNWWQGSLYY